MRTALRTATLTRSSTQVFPSDALLRSLQPLRGALVAYSKAYEKRAARRAPWPDLRYNLATGECKLFFKPEDVPRGWVTHKATRFTTTEPTLFNREDLIKQLIAKGVSIDPKWGTAHLKKVLDATPKGAV